MGTRRAYKNPSLGSRWKTARPMLEYVRYSRSSIKFSRMIASPSLLRISKIPSTGSRQPSSISRSAASRSGRLATNRSTTVLSSGRRYCNANRSMMPIASASSNSSMPALSMAAPSDRFMRGLHANSTRSRFSAVLRATRTPSPSSDQCAMVSTAGPYCHPERHAIHPAFLGSWVIDPATAAHAGRSQP